MNKISFELFNLLIIILSLAQTENNGRPGNQSDSNPSKYILKNYMMWWYILEDKYFIFLDS